MNSCICTIIASLTWIGRICGIMLVVRCVVRDMRVCVDGYVYSVLMDAWIDPREQS